MNYLMIQVILKTRNEQMKIIITLPDDEAYREIECEEENIRAAYRELIRNIRNICLEKKIRYENIETIFSEG